MSTFTDLPNKAVEAIFLESEEIPPNSIPIKGYEFNDGIDFNKLMESYLSTGFQATAIAEAILEINRMIHWRLSDEPITEDEVDEYKDMEVRKNIKCTIFFSYTSNMVSCGVREIIRYLAEHKMIDCIVTTGGGIEEDFIKCLAPFYLGDFNLRGAELRERGINRTGNLLVPNKNYCIFEEWITPILDKMWEEQQEGEIWSPSKLINRLGKEINNPQSIYYWCYKNEIPVFCPAITDGSIGDMLFFHSYKKKGFIMDLIQDIRAINRLALFAKKTGMIILGGGVIKHHVCNANLMRNGADFSVFINTAQEFDGSDAGARPDEAVSWGKIKATAHPVKVYAEATIVFPLIVAQTFAKEIEKQKNQSKSS